MSIVTAFLAGFSRHYLRKVKARTNELLETAIAEALDRVTASDILAWFAENGYRI